MTRKLTNHLVQRQMLFLHLQVTRSVLQQPRNEATLFITTLLIDNLLLLRLLGQLRIHNGLQKRTTTLAVLSQLGDLGQVLRDKGALPPGVLADGVAGLDAVHGVGDSALEPLFLARERATDEDFSGGKSDDAEDLHVQRERAPVLAVTEFLVEAEADFFLEAGDGGLNVTGEVLTLRGCQYSISF